MVYAGRRRKVGACRWWRGKKERREEREVG
jgi:hypothetical protein